MYISGQECQYLTSMSSIDNTTDTTVATEDTAICPIVEALDQIGSQWRLVVLHDLIDGEKRFNELKRSTDANPRTLSRVLDDLEDGGFVHRRVEDRPVATYYRLTEKGASLQPVFEEVECWSREWVFDD